MSQIEEDISLGNLLTASLDKIAQWLRRISQQRDCTNMCEASAKLLYMVDDMWMWCASLSSSISLMLDAEC